MERLVRGINTHIGKVLEGRLEVDGEVIEPSFPLRIIGRTRRFLFVIHEQTGRTNWLDRDEVRTGSAGIVKFNPTS